MLKKLSLFCLCLFTFHSLNSTTIPLETGRWILDRYRNVEIDQFGYSYQIESIEESMPAFKLQDGSVWEVVPMNAESISFYTQKSPPENGSMQTSIFGLWQPGDILIFHKTVDRPSLLAYNVTRDLLLDVQPIRTPVIPTLRITSITNTNDIYFTHNYNKKTRSYEQKIHNDWRTIIALSDGTIWEGNPDKPLLNWIIGDAIHIAKDTPWWSSNTHILMNFKPTKNSANSVPKFSRLGTWRAG